MARVYIVGTGAVGTGFGCALREVGWQVVGAWNRGEARAALASKRLGVVVATGELAAIPAVDLVLVCVSDDALQEVGARLTAEPGTVVAHTSGCAASTRLGSIVGAELGSLHPLVAMPEPDTAAAALRGAAFALEGSPAASALLERVVGELGGRAFRVRTEDKPRYHAAAVMASNLVVALLGDAVSEAEASGIDDARALMTELALGAVRNVAAHGAADALTGPVARGDAATVAEHLGVLEGESAEVYRLLSRRALALAGLSDDHVGRIQQLLGSRLPS